MRTQNSYRFRSNYLCVLTTGIVFIAGCSTPLAARFKSHITYLASDRLEGRGVGTEGLELAAEYIADEFTKCGLEPAGESGTYFQTFPMAMRRTLTDEARLAIAGGTANRTLGEDFIPFSFSSNDEFDGGVIFCGYGIEAADKSHNDFEGLDLAGAVALVLRGEPASWAEENGGATRHASFRSKVYNVKDAGGVAVLIVNQSPEAPDDVDELVEFDERSADAYGIPAFHVSRKFAQEMLDRGGLGSLGELQDRLDAGSFVSAQLGHVAVSGKAALRTQSAPTRNVIAMVPGTGPNADECVVIGAHYDHLGIRKPMSRKFKAGKLVREETQPQIHNGADDNASGVAGLIEIARMAAKGPRPDRSMVFVAFTAEETGLHGSTHYVKEPAHGLDKTVAMLNMDMIGRMEPGNDKVLVFGAKSGIGIQEVVTAEADRIGLTVESSTGTGGRSDQAPFLRKKIPALHFFTGIHADYHKPGDDAEKINAEGGAAVTKLVYRVARALADQPERPEFHAVKMKRRDQQASGGTPSYRVVMGLAPGYAEGEEPGMAVDGVTDEGPADMAGMKAGDRIVSIDGKKVDNVYDYMAATRKNKPGDTVEVVVVRDGQEMTLRVTLAPAR